MTRKPPSTVDAWLRWINVILRGAHLASVILLGAALLGAPVAMPAAALAVAGSGFSMLAMDIWRKPQHLREAAGIAVLLKLVLVGWMAFDAAAQQILFWVIVAGSAISAHAPARFRHAVLVGNKPH